jgi:hypothetical protein
MIYKYEVGWESKLFKIYLGHFCMAYYIPEDQGKVYLIIILFKKQMIFKFSRGIIPKIEYFLLKRKFKKLNLL